MTETFFLCARVVCMALAVWCLIEVCRSIRRNRGELNEKGEEAHLVFLFWGCLTLYGISEQIYQGAPGGPRTLGTIAVLLLTIRLLRRNGGTRRGEEIE